jgi:hypothetical protein
MTRGVHFGQSAAERLPSADADDRDVGNRRIHEIGHLETRGETILEQRGAEERAPILPGRAVLDPGEQLGCHCRLLGFAQSLTAVSVTTTRQLTPTVDDLG